MTQSHTEGVSGPDFYGPDFYDHADVFATYLQRRSRIDSPNDTLEKPVVWQLVQAVNWPANHVLDLGCGDGAFGIEVLQAGCRTYTGVEGSQRMAELARTTLADVQAATIFHANLEAWTSPAAQYDLVVSRLVLHYVADLAALLRRVHHCLVPGGRFVFSVEHPVITSCNRSLGEDGAGLRQDWIVDDYFVSGRRDVLWMGKHVVKFHRTVEDYYSMLQEAGFVVTHLRESRPVEQLFHDEALLQRRRRIPLFLFMAAHTMP